MPYTTHDALGFVEDTLTLAEATGDAAIAMQTELAGLGAMFLARAGQSYRSAALLSQNGLIGDAMTVSRTVLEMTIDYRYIAKDAPTRIKKFTEYDYVTKFRLMKAVDKLHGGKLSQHAMRVLEQRHDTARTNNPESTHNWAGVSLRKRAEDTGRMQLWELPYADMCNASHSCYGTLEYALVGLDAEPKIRFGTMEPHPKAIDLAFTGMVLLISEVVEANTLDATLGERTTALLARHKALLEEKKKS